MPARTKVAGARQRKTRRPQRRYKPASMRRAGGEIALAMFAHEIRTALTGILALGELLSTADLGAREREWARAVKGTAEHLAALTTLVVDAAKTGSAQLELRRDVFRLPLFVEAIAASLAGRARGKGLAVNLDVAADLPKRVRGDVVRLRGALENLIDNAVKFTDRGSVGLSVAAARAPRGRMRITFDVSDTGLGLDPAAIKRLFRPYAQASAEVARLYGGAGLGLVSVKRLAKAMGGDLTVTSAPGAGSRFRLTVSLAIARAPAARGGAKRAATARPLRILCVEDNPFARVILDTIATELGHSAAFAATGEAAVAAVAGNGFDAVLMDVALPALDGFAATRRIRALGGHAGAVPIIGVSGSTEPDNEAAAQAAGMNAYLRKPVSPLALKETLAAVTTPPRGQRA